MSDGERVDGGKRVGGEGAASVDKGEGRSRRESAVRRAFAEDGARKTHVGGQALIEGVMMRGRFSWAAAVREPGGGVYVEEHDLASGKKGREWLHWPVVRGCCAFVESLALGYKALEVATLHAYDEEGESYFDRQRAALGASAAAAPQAESPDAAFVSETAASRPTPRRGDVHAAPQADMPHAFSWKDDFGNPDEAVEALGAQTRLQVVEGDAPDAAPFEFGKREMAVSMALGLALGVALFIVAPAFVANLIVGDYDGRTLLWNLVDGAVRVAVFVFYIWLIGQMRDIKRMFGYHGAEHKAIHCFEHGLPMTPENARSFPRLHVRCGTAFLIMVMIIAIVVYTLTPLDGLIAAWGITNGAAKLAVVIAARLVLLPVIAGISYEITVKWAGSRPENPVVRVVLWPGLQMQRLTTREPDDGQIECAIAAMQAVLAREGE